MNMTKQQVREILDLLDYVGEEVWGKTRTELSSRVKQIKDVIEEGLGDEK